MAFETFMIGESVRNVAEGAEITGFHVPIRIPYYRGVVLSLIEDVEISVDGQSYPRESLRFGVRDVELSLDDLGADGTTRWEFGEWARIVVAKPGGLAEGEHVVDLAQQFRISYLPWPMRAEASKRVRVAA